MSRERGGFQGTDETIQPRLVEEPWLMPGGPEVVEIDSVEPREPYLREWKRRDPDTYAECARLALAWDHEDFVTTEGTWRVPEDTDALLNDFLALAEPVEEPEDRDAATEPVPDRILEFARAYGPLELCEGHGQPLSYCRAHFREEWTDPETGHTHAGCPLLEPEPLTAWRYWADRAAATLRLAQALRDGEWGREEDWATVTQTSLEAFRNRRAAAVGLADLVDRLAADSTVEHDREALEGMPAWDVEKLYGEKYGAPQERQSRWSPHLQLEGVLQEWLDLGQVRPRVEWREGRGPRLRDYGRRLFGSLAHRLVCAAVGEQRRATCDGCGALHLPERKPRADRRNFCETCRRNKVPQKLRKRRQRARSAG